MIMNKITPAAEYNQWLKRLTHNLLNQPIKIQWKPQQLLSQQIRKHYYKNFGGLV